MSKSESHASTFWDWKGFISVLALFLSGLSIWYSYLSPFRPDIVSGRVIWRFEEFKEPSPRVLALVNTIQVSNLGARAGCILDLIVEVSTPRGTKWLFFPASYIDLAAFFQVPTPDTRSLMSFIEWPFHPLIVLGRDQVTRAILFLPADPASIGTLTDGDYALGLKARMCGQEVYKDFGRSTYSITQSDVLSLQSGHPLVGISKEVEEGRPKP